MERDSPPSSNRLCHEISVEQIGSGIRRIRDVCLEYGVAEPIFEVSHDCLTPSLPRNLQSITPRWRLSGVELVCIKLGESAPLGSGKVFEKPALCALRALSKAKRGAVQLWE